MKTTYLDKEIDFMERLHNLKSLDYEGEKRLTEFKEIKQKLTLQGVVASKPTSKDVLNKAVSAIYFNDNSDYLKALYGIVNDLTDLKEPIDIRSLYKSLNPD